jgi:hypothetical protein
MSGIRCERGVIGSGGPNDASLVIGLTARKEQIR